MLKSQKIQLRKMKVNKKNIVSLSKVICPFVHLTFCKSSEVAL